jgi:acyl dehydratase
MIYFEDLKEGIEYKTEKYTITKAEILEFARKFDPQPFHIDEVAASKSLYGEIIASGWHTSAIYMKLCVESFLNKVASLGSPGVDEMRWKRPVKPGDTLIARFKIIKKRSYKKRIGIIIHKGELMNQKNKIVMSLIGKGLIKRRNS